jgi:hypothetical protein
VLFESVIGQGFLQFARKKKKKLENRKVLREEEEKINDECFLKVGLLKSAKVYLSSRDRDLTMFPETRRFPLGLGTSQGSKKGEYSYSFLL